ncbi:MAG: hypothetical protein JWP91_400 [Fibrobacteres bacterium]|nr:hypothetical protein [Fibrobacterota bacterium]
MKMHASLLLLPFLLLGCDPGETAQPSQKGNELSYGFQIDYTWWVPFSWGDREIGTNRLQGVAVIDNPYIYKWMGSYASGYWRNIGSGASKITMETNGNPVVTMPDGNAWRYNMLTSAWEMMNFGYLVRDVSISSDGAVWIQSTQLQTTGNYWIGFKNPNGTISWAGGAKKVAADRKEYQAEYTYNHAWAISAAGDLSFYLASGAWLAKPPTGPVVGTKLSDISVGGNSIVYAVANDFDAAGNATVWWVRNDGAIWENVAGARGVRVALGDDQDIFIIQANGTTLHHYIPHSI